MGREKNITANKFPEQTKNVGKRVEVYYHDDVSKREPGIIIRDDNTAPYVMIIKTDSGRHVLATECQFMYDHR